MTGSDLKKTLEEFKATDELKRKTINAAHSREHRKLLKTKREKFATISGVVAFVAFDIVLFFVFNIGGAFSLTANSIKNPISSGQPTTQLSTENMSNSSTESLTVPYTEKSTEKTTENSTEKSTDGNRETTTAASSTKAQEVASTETKATNAPVSADNTTNKSSLQVLNGSTTYTNSWTNMNPISSTVYNFSGGNGSIEVKTLSTTSTGTLIETKVGPNEMCSVRIEVYPGLFNDGLSITKSGDGIVTFTNDKEGIIVRENIVNFPKEAAESQSAYVTRGINYISAALTDANIGRSAFSLSNDYVFNTKSAGVMTNSDTEWRAVMKMNYTGDPISSLSNTSYGGFGYLTVVFDKSSQCFIVQTYVAQVGITNRILSALSYSCYGLKYKVN